MVLVVMAVDPTKNAQVLQKVSQHKRRDNAKEKRLRGQKAMLSIRSGKPSCHLTVGSVGYTVS